MKQRVHILHDKLKGFVHRLCLESYFDIFRIDYSVLKSTLPSMREYVILVRLSKLQKTLYKYYLAKVGIRNTLFLVN